MSMTAALLTITAIPMVVLVDAPFPWAYQLGMLLIALAFSFILDMLKKKDSR